jgi:hypothetical protein
LASSLNTRGLEAAHPPVWLRIVVNGLIYTPIDICDILRYLLVSGQ